MKTMLSIRRTVYSFQVIAMVEEHRVSLFKHGSVIIDLNATRMENILYRRSTDVLILFTKRPCRLDPVVDGASILADGDVYHARDETYGQQLL